MSREREDALLALRNLGPRSAGWLREAGIRSPRELERVGPIEAYRRVAARHPGQVSLNLLWSLVGALADLDYRSLPAELKEQLKRRLRESGRPSRRRA